MGAPPGPDGGLTPRPPTPDFSKRVHELWSILRASSRGGPVDLFWWNSGCADKSIAPFMGDRWQGGGMVGEVLGSRGDMVWCVPLLVFRSPRMVLTCPVGMPGVGMGDTDGSSEGTRLFSGCIGAGFSQDL
jgi:hypothetical protein